MAVDVEPVVTMADFRKACEDRLDYAIAHNEDGLHVHTDEMTGGETKPLELFETPAGLSIVRYAGTLTVECDFGDTDSDAEYVASVEFNGESDDPDVTLRHNGHNTTVARRQFNAFATELSKYVTLVV